ncbi:hypothetical protein B0A48_04684 [Cryoendolithus antarcticus]|uniref:J domain-containing protein n=1 Tax=Cryoendolithus antarcticus TaxID=1507870 RepID=A0A1V8TG13_9PEZI|nr:hypothetical protein B0A48_04684 [Cryoendolithus antarcticus]
MNPSVNTTEDFYELLGISSHAGTDAEIRRAYRKTALKYHPDKVGSDAAAAAKFHDLQVAFDVLSDPASKEAYDDARRTREARQEREQQFEGRRKQFKDELEARENASLKRKRGDDVEDDAYRREIARLAADGKRRREELTAKLRKEQEAETTTQPQAEVTDEIDRSIKLRFRQTAETAHLTQASLMETFSRYGKIEYMVLRDKRIKVPGEKHRADFTLATLVFVDVVGARAAVNARVEHVEDIGWLKGTEPEVEIPKVATESIVGLDATLERLRKAEIRRREKLETEKVDDTPAENV